MTNRVSDIVSDEDLSCIVQIESAGNPNAKAPTSSALGLGQFLKGTWLPLVRKYHPEMKDEDDATLLAMRKDPAFSIEMLGWFTEENANALGAGWTSGDLYLAHFLGVGAARKVMRQPANMSVEPVVGPDAVRANLSILKGKTCGQVRAWAQRKMDGAKGHDWVGKYYVAPEVQDEIPDDAVPSKIEPYDPNEPLVPDWSQVSSDTAQADTTPHGQVNNQIANVQKTLVDMNYNEVGIINGAWGGGTKAGIAAFLNDRGRDDLSVDMSQGVLDELAKARLEGFKRPISEARASITPKDLAKYNPTMLSTLRTKAVALWGMILSGGTALFTGASSYFHSLWDMIAPLRKVLDTVPGFVWVALAVAGCALLYINAHKAEQDTSDAFKNRRLLR